MSKSKRNKLGIALWISMALCLLANIILFIISPYRESSLDFKCGDIFILEYNINYPLSQISFLLLFLSIIYLIFVDSIKKSIKYTIGAFLIVFLIIILFQGIQRKRAIIELNYEIFNTGADALIDSSRFNTGFDLKDFILGREHH